MMAPAMNTRTDEQFRYRELARQKARIERSISLERLPRLLQSIGPETKGQDRTILVGMMFRLDQEGDVWVAGEVSGLLRLLCQGCAEMLDHPMQLEFELCLVDSDRRAGELQDREVMVVEGDELSLIQLIEDELLLGLPERLCVTEPCERAPGLHYPAAGSEDTGVTGADFALSANRRRPFEALEGLRDSLKSASAQSQKDKAEE